MTRGRGRTVSPRGAAAIGAFFVAALFLGGCASGGGGAASGSSAAVLPDRLFTLGIALPEDHRDFTRMDLFAPELRSFFDRTRDAYGIDGVLDPFAIEFASGSTFRWDLPVPELVREAVVRELGRDDLVRWVKPMPTSETPRFIVHVNVGEFHYQRADRALYPQVSLEALVLDGRSGEVLFKAPARLRDEFGVANPSGSLNNHVLMVEDWLERDLRDQMERALEKATEKLVRRIDVDFLQVEADKLAPPPPVPSGG